MLFRKRQHPEPRALPKRERACHDVAHHALGDDSIGRGEYGPVGQKIGLMIFSSDRDFTLHPEKGTKLTIDLDATSIEIPVVGGVEALKKATQE